MEKLIGKGYLGQSAVVVIAILLVLKLVLPYIGGPNPDQTVLTIDETHLNRAMDPILEPIELLVRDLIVKNNAQCKSDETGVVARTKLIEVITKLSHQQEMTATAVAAMTRQMERMRP